MFILKFVVDLTTTKNQKSFPMTEEELIALTAKEFNIKEDSIDLSTNYKDLPNWDSLNALIFISSINDQFGALLSSSDLLEANTLEDIHKRIQQKF